MSNVIRLSEAQPGEFLRFEGASPLSFYNEVYEEWTPCKEFYFEGFEGEVGICRYGPGLKRMFHLHGSTKVVVVETPAIAC